MSMLSSDRKVSILRTTIGKVQLNSKPSFCSITASVDGGDSSALCTADGWHSSAGGGCSTTMAAALGGSWSLDGPCDCHGVCASGRLPNPLPSAQCRPGAATRLIPRGGGARSEEGARLGVEDACSS